ncbi:hypothetical protein ACSS6W_002339 [Trichoderma asperelloides]
MSWRCEGLIDRKYSLHLLLLAAAESRRKGKLRARRQRPPETFQAPPSRLQGSELDAVFVSPTPRGQKVSGEYLRAGAGLAYAGIVTERYKHAFTSTSWQLCRPGKASGSVHDLILSPWHAPASIWSVGTPPTAAVPASIWKAQQRALKIRADMRLTQLAARQDGYRLSAGLPDPWSLA